MCNTSTWECKAYTSDTKLSCWGNIRIFSVQSVVKGIQAFLAWDFINLFCNALQNHRRETQGFWNMERRGGGEKFWYFVTEIFYLNRKLLSQESADSDTFAGVNLIWIFSKKSIMNNCHLYTSPYKTSKAKTYQNECFTFVLQHGAVRCGPVPAHCESGMDKGISV